MKALLAILLVMAPAAWSQDLVPARGGVNFVLAVNVPPDGTLKGAGIIQGDYEMVVTLDSLDSRGLALTANYDGKDETGTWRRGKVKRLILAPDLELGDVHIHGWHGRDELIIPGTTSLGPSRQFVRALANTGRVDYRFRMWSFGNLASGVLERTGAVKFPVLINGRRVQLPAIHAQGHMTLDGNKAPFEMIVLDHPQHPLALRIANGARNGGFPFKPRFAREIVRIDYADEKLQQALVRDCRVELPGIYFDFNRDSLKPESARALAETAGLLRRMDGRPMVIEGHTDNVGGDAYNDDLSRRRAEAVRNALVADHGVAVDTLTTQGFGERKPVETNDTIAGRARNRRVELACATNQNE